MKKAVTPLITAAVAAILFFTSCSNEKKPEDSKEVAENKNEQRFENKAAEKDAAFLVEATTISIEEVGLGELAKTKGTIQDVKDLGAMMVTDHEKAIEEVKGLAAKKSVAIPDRLNDDAQKDIGKFSEKKDKEFDKDYCDKMVDGHKKAIEKFESQVKDGQDADIKAWAEQTLPTLRKHLDHAMACRDKCK